MSRDRRERKHRRTARHPECVTLMAAADFDRVPSLSAAMGLEPAVCPLCARPCGPGEGGVHDACADEENARSQ